MSGHQQEPIPELNITRHQNPGYSLSELLRLHKKYGCQHGAEEVAERLMEGDLREIARMDAMLWSVHLKLYRRAGGNINILALLEHAQEFVSGKTRIDRTSRADWVTGHANRPLAWERTLKSSSDHTSSLYAAN